MKIQIIGGSGTGKSTLARYISEKQGVRWIDTDNYLWKDQTFTEKLPVELRYNMYENETAHLNDYVVSGSTFSWHPDGFIDRDLLVFLFLEEEVRMERLVKREIERESPMRQLRNGEATNDFLDWCKTYLKAGDYHSIGSYAEHVHQMELSKAPVLQLDSSLSLEELYRRTMEFIES